MVSEFFTFPNANDKNYLDNLYKVIEAFKIDVLIHGCEPELKLFAKNRKAISEKGALLLLNSNEVIDLCMDKVATNDFLESNGFNPPKYIEAKNVDDFSKIDWYPVVVKPSLGGGGSANVYIAQSESELFSLAEYLHLDEDGISFIIQEYVGTADNEFTVGVLSSMSGEFINSIAVKRLMSGQLNIRSKVKNRTQRADLGDELIVSSGISQGIVGKFPEVTKQCEAIAKKINSRGPLNIQCRLVDGQVKVFEINPRFSGTSSLRAMVGFNEPDLLIRHHFLHEKIEKNFPFDEKTIIRSLKESFV
jgi:carbamoyl-phosphate synthase large subunit